MAKFALPTLEIPTEATRPLYAAAGATDVVVGYVRDAVADLQKSVTGVQKDVQTRIASFDFEPKALRDQAVTVVTAQIDALSKDAKVRREAIEKRVAELQADAAGIPATVTATYADLAKRGEVLVGRIRTQESTKATADAVKTTTTKAKTTKTQATKAAKKTTKSTAKKATSTAKKTSTAPKSSAKATTTAARKTAAAATEAATDAAAKIGD
jgi:heparin binding hemagglutinin HbhA